MIRDLNIGRVFFLVFLAFTEVLIQVAQSSAAPSIQTVDGTVTNGSSITVNGTGFGASGPNVVLFDDFEKGTNGNDIPLGAGPSSATVGQWDQYTFTGFEPYYTNTQHLSGSLALQSDLSSPTLTNIGTSLPPDPSEVFISYWCMIPAGDKWPGEGHSEGINWKIIWLQGHDVHDDDLTLPTMLGQGSTITGYIVTGNGTQNYVRYINLDLKKGEWKRVSVWLRKGASNNGSTHIWGLDSTQKLSTLLSDDNVSNILAGGAWERVIINGYGRKSPPSHPTFDDVYIAAGANARARVEIGNKSTYTENTNLTLATVTAWSSSQITATVRQGSFPSNAPAYLYVIDANGAVNTTGFPVVFGGTDTVAPNAPENLRVNP